MKFYRRLGIGSGAPFVQRQVYWFGTGRDSYRDTRSRLLFLAVKVATPSQEKLSAPSDPAEVWLALRDRIVSKNGRFWQLLLD